MSYSKSPARLEFENKSTFLLKECRTASYKKTNISYNHSTLIFQASIFILCSTFENYFKNLFEDIIYSYKTKNALLKELPDNFRSLAILNNQIGAYKSYLLNGDEGKILKRLDVKTNRYYKIVDDNLVFSNHFSYSTIIGSRKYPSTKNLIILFKRLGVNNIFDTINRKGGKDYKLDLESFLDIREILAHQSTPSITFIDFVRHYKNISEITKLIDRAVYTQIVRVSKEKYWV